MPRASTRKTPKMVSGKKLVGKYGEVYRASVNLCGLYSTEPLLCRWKPNDCNPDSGGEFWDRKGDADVRADWPDGVTLKPHKDDDFIVFASRDKQRVEDWISGAVAVLDRIRDFAGTAAE